MWVIVIEKMAFSREIFRQCLTFDYVYMNKQVLWTMEVKKKNKALLYHLSLNYI